MSADQLKTIIQELKEKGKDVTQIEAALTGGNTTKAQMLLDEFWKNNPDERPAPKNPGEKPPQ
jgi:siroheme synthase